MNASQRADWVRVIVNNYTPDEVIQRYGQVLERAVHTPEDRAARDSLSRLYEEAIAEKCVNLDCRGGGLGVAVTGKRQVGLESKAASYPQA